MWINELMTKKQDTQHEKTNNATPQRGTVLPLKVIPTWIRQTDNTINNNSGSTQVGGFIINICSDEMRWKGLKNSNKEDVPLSVLQIPLPVTGAVFSTTIVFSSSATALVGSSGFMTGCGLVTSSIKKEGIEVL